MSNYRRLYLNQATYFFTLVTHQRKPILCQPQSISRLKEAFRYTAQKYPFTMKGLVILPDHLHCIWQLPQDDSDFSIRWSLIKRYFSLGQENEPNHRREKNIWQRRFWEHVIRDEEGYWKCQNYIHYNPVKHGYVDKPYQWQYGSFHHLVLKGFYDKDWGANVAPDNIKNLDWE